MADIKCTVTNVVVKFPYGVQAEDDTAAALTAISCEKAATETDARAATFTCLLPGDLRSKFLEGEEVVVTLNEPVAARGGAAKPGAEAEHGGAAGGVTTKTVTASVSHTQARPAR